MVNQHVATELGTVVRAVSARGAHADAVVVGDATELLDYELLDRAFHAIRHGADMLALQRGRYFRAADGDPDLPHADHVIDTICDLASLID